MWQRLGRQVELICRPPLQLTDNVPVPHSGQQNTQKCFNVSNNSVISRTLLDTIFANRIAIASDNRSNSLKYIYESRLS